MANLIKRVYSNFRGVDFRGNEINLLRSPDSLNMWKDYKETESIRTRPALEELLTYEGTIFGIFFYKVGSNEMLLVHQGTKLMKLVNGQAETLYNGLNPAKSNCFVYNNIWYFKDGINYLEYDGEEIKEVVGYVPTTTIGRNPLGGGTKYEDVNMLSNERINSFLSDGINTEYVLDAIEIDSTKQVEVKIDGKVIEPSEYEVDFVNGKVTFKEAPPLPLTDGQDNVTIRFSRTVNGYKERITQCTMLQVFDNRVFFSGNPDYPNVIFHCSLNNPRYCSDLDYYNEGLDLARVTGLVAGNNALWVFKEPSQANTTVFYHNPAIDAEYGKIYPSVHSNITTGCIGKAINFNDDIVFFSDRGMEAINGDVTTEQIIAHRSTLVDRKLTAEAEYKEMLLEEYEGYLFVFIGNKVYLADSRAMFQNENHYEYEWFYWELDKRITTTVVKDGVLYLGTEDGKIYTLTDTETGLRSYWTTPLDKFNNPQNMKTTNKRGCVVEALGDLTISAKTNKGDWEEIETFSNVTDYFVVKRKFKKFKDIQLKFSSSTRFSLEQATLEVFVGGYIKR